MSYYELKREKKAINLIKEAEQGKKMKEETAEMFNEAESSFVKVENDHFLRVVGLLRDDDSKDHLLDREVPDSPEVNKYEHLEEVPLPDDFFRISRPLPKPSPPETPSPELTYDFDDYYEEFKLIDTPDTSMADTAGGAPKPVLTPKPIRNNKRRPDKFKDFQLY